MDYQAYTRERLNALRTIFAKAAVGDFSENLSLPDTNDEFTELYMGIQIMIEVIRQQLAELSQQKEMYKTLVDHSPDIIARFDKKFRHIFVNSEVERSVGIPAATFIGKTNQELGMPQDLSMYWQNTIQTVFQTGTEQQIEFELPLPNDGIRYFHSRIVPEYNGVGEITSVLGITHDITELKLIEKKSHELASIVESTDEAIVGLTLDGTIKSWNKGAEKMYGYTANEILGKPLGILIPADRKDEEKQIIDKIKQGVSLEHYETVRLKKDGIPIYVSKTLSPTKDSKGTITGYSALATDITFRKTAENMLIQSTEQLEVEKSKVDAILSSIGDGVFAVDKEGKISVMNAVAEHISGYSVNEAIGKIYQDIFHFEYENDPAKPYPSFVQHVITSGETTQFMNHTLLVAKDGKKISITFNATPTKDENGRTLGCVVVIRNNTKERALEKAKDEFISIAAHQLRTPLGTIRWTMEMLMEGRSGPVPPAFHDKLERIYNSNQRLILLVKDLLNVSRIEQGRALNEPTTTNLLETIELILRDSESDIKKKSLTCNIHKPESLPSVFVDPKRLYQTVQNIVSNAIKYSNNQGTIDITITTDEKEINVAVEDSGMGIPEDESKLLFSKFFRASNAASETEGTGLGLFIVKSNVDGWKGKIWIDSPTKTREDNGKTVRFGTTVHFTIPYEKNINH